RSCSPTSACSAARAWSATQRTRAARWAWRPWRQGRELRRLAALAPPHPASSFLRKDSAPLSIASDGEGDGGDECRCPNGLSRAANCSSAYIHVRHFRLPLVLPMEGR